MTRERSRELRGGPARRDAPRPKVSRSAPRPPEPSREPASPEDQALFGRNPVLELLRRGSRRVEEIADPLGGPGTGAPRAPESGQAPGGEDLLPDAGPADRHRRGPPPPGGRGPGGGSQLLLPRRPADGPGRTGGARVLPGPRPGSGPPEPRGGAPIGRGHRGSRADRAQAPRGRPHRGGGQVGHGGGRAGAGRPGDEPGPGAGRIEERMESGSSEQFPPVGRRPGSWT